jgi:hypothetical protein
MVEQQGPVVAAVGLQAELVGEGVGEHLGLAGDAERGAAEQRQRGVIEARPRRGDPRQREGRGQRRLGLVVLEARLAEQAGRRSLTRGRARH